MIAHETQIAVIGAGPAGLTAALAANRLGAQVTLVDEFPRPGGAIYKQTPLSFHTKPVQRVSKEQSHAHELFSQLRNSSVKLLTETLVWGLQNSHTLALYREGAGTETLRFQSLIITTGGYDRPIAFPGWTLPGVWTAGGAQTMVKAQQVRPGQRVLLAGSGPILMPVAKSLIDSGATVVAIAEATTLLQWVSRVRDFLGFPNRIVEFLNYESFFLRRHVPSYFGHIMVSAEGDKAVRRATIVGVDRDWRPRPGTAKTFEVDLVCTGYGFLSATEIPSLLGCTMRFDPLQGQRIPSHNEEMETSIPGVFVAGESAGVGGSDLAQVEGAVAGLVAAQQVGQTLKEADQQLLIKAQDKRRHLQKYANILAEMFAMRPGIYELAQPDTFICRCEEVTVGEIMTAIQRGARNINALKSWVRVGMGPCQGRVCGAQIAQLLARHASVPLEEIVPMTPRPPIKPIPIGAFAELAENEILH